MKHLYLVANWKSNKSIKESIEWVRTFKSQTLNFKLKEHIHLILCVPFTVVSSLQEEIKLLDLPFCLGVQNISSFPTGAYTGEISASMIKEIAQWTIIGHSERRKYFYETDDILLKKVEQGKAEGLDIIYCIENSDVSVPFQIDAIAYEPVNAIGSGKAQPPQDAEVVCKQIKTLHPRVPVLYGGSVGPDNIAGFCGQPSIDGVLVGTASLDSDKFFHLIEAVSSL